MDKFGVLIEQLEDILGSHDEYELREAIEKYDNRLTYIPVINEGLKKRFITKLMGDVDKWQLSANTCRLLSCNLGEFLKRNDVSENTEFVELLRGVQLELLKKGKSMLNDSLSSAQSNSFEGLETKSRLTLLEGNIREIRINMVISNLVVQRQDLIGKRNNREISSEEYSKQNQIIQLSFERENIELGCSKAFTDYNWYALQTRIGDLKVKEGQEVDLEISKNLYYESLYNYRKYKLELEMKDNEIALAQGDISLEEFQQEELRLISELDKIKLSNSNEKTSGKYTR